MLYDGESTMLLGNLTTSEDHISFVIYSNKQIYIDVMQAYAPRVDECLGKQNNDIFKWHSKSQFKTS